MAKTFGSDNHSGVHPRIMQALVEANHGHVPAYGGDPLTEAARQSFKKHFGADAEVLFVFNGTGANVLGVQCCCLPYQAVIVSDVAHMNQDECGAPERHTGCKLLVVKSPDGKLTPELVAPCLIHERDQHQVVARVISVTQATEYGVVYRQEELRELAEIAHRHDMVLHMDGARLCGAAASLGLSLGELTSACGVDILSFGGTKNGLMFGEALVILNQKLIPGAVFHRKQAMQLASKMRFIAAQFRTYLDQDLWLSNARAANHMARELAARLSRLPEARLIHPVDCNELFVELPRSIYEKVQEKWHFYVWDEQRQIIRLLTSFDTTLGDVEELVADLEKAR